MQTMNSQLESHKQDKKEMFTSKENGIWKDESVVFIDGLIEGGHCERVLPGIGTQPK